MLTSANTSRTGRSVLEATVGQPIVHFADLWLTGRGLAPQGDEASLVPVRIHFTAGQAVGPGLTQGTELPQQGYLAVAVASPQVDQSAPWSLLQVELPAHGKGTAVRGGFDARRPVPAQGSDIPLGMPPQSPHGVVLGTGPDLGLPPPAVALH